MRTQPKTFEESLLRLEEIVKNLDVDKSSLETMLAGYEEGVGLLRQCHQMLESAERKIEILRNPASDGSSHDIQTAAESDFRTTEREA